MLAKHRLSKLVHLQWSCAIGNEDNRKLSYSSHNEANQTKQKLQWQKRWTCTVLCFILYIWLIVDRNMYRFNVLLCIGCSCIIVFLFFTNIVSFKHAYVCSNWGQDYSRCCWLASKRPPSLGGTPKKQTNKNTNKQKHKQTKHKLKPNTVITQKMNSKQVLVICLGLVRDKTHVVFHVIKFIGSNLFLYHHYLLSFAFLDILYCTLKINASSRSADNLQLRSVAHSATFRALSSQEVC